MKKLNLRKRYYWEIIFVLGSIGLVFAMLGTSPSGTRAQERGGPGVIDRDSVAYGRTYGDWSAAWWQWAFSIPVAHHPLFDNDLCSVGQSGPVWFLGGKFLGGSATVATRSCSLPPGKALYFPILNSEDSAPEESQGWECGNLLPLLIGTIAEMRQCAEGAIDGATGLSAEIDGQAIGHLKERFRVQSIVFGYTLPDDNLLKATGETGIPEGTYFPAVDDGVYVMLSPLPPGHHVLHFHGAVPAYSFTLDITYNLAVAR